MLADDESRRTFASVIKQRVTGNHGYLRMASYREYEHPLVKALAGDWVADCGASNGKTSFRFADQVGEKGTVFAFEPDPTNVSKIKATQDKKGYRNVKIVNAAVSDAPGTMRFESAKGGSSRLSETGDIEVAIDTLDNVLTSHAVKGRGVISFDVEGFERQALEGGMNVIKRLRPKLQISAYHKMQDLFSLPLWLHKTLPDYSFYMGHHDSYHSETDLYAVPNELIH